MHKNNDHCRLIYNAKSFCDIIQKILNDITSQITRRDYIIDILCISCRIFYLCVSLSLSDFNMLLYFMTLVALAALCHLFK